MKVDRSRRRILTLLGGGAAYGAVLFFVAQFAFATGFGAGLGLPANLMRAGTYRDWRLPEVAAVDSNQIARAITEARGGPPTIASPPPPPPIEAPEKLSTQQPERTTEGSPASKPPSAAIVPTSKAQTTGSMDSIASLLAKIAATYQFPLPNPAGPPED
jgi:hypothetical protein